MRSITTRAGTALATGLLALAFAVPASAQQPASPAPAKPDVAELTTFAEAYVDIQQINTDLQAKMAAAQSEEEKAQLQTQAETQSAAALEQRGIEKERYQEIANLLNTDNELRAQFEEIQAQVQEKRKGGG